MNFLQFACNVPIDTERYVLVAPQCLQSLSFEPPPRLWHCPRQGTLGADQVRGIYAKSRVKEGPIGKLFALLVLEARPSTDEDPCSQLRFEQPEGMPVRNWRRSSGDPPFAIVGGPHRVEWGYGSDYIQEFERNSQKGEAKESVV
jgi:hypothetical protein